MTNRTELEFWHNRGNVEFTHKWALLNERVVILPGELALSSYCTFHVRHVTLNLTNAMLISMTHEGLILFKQNPDHKTLTTHQMLSSQSVCITQPFVHK